MSISNADTGTLPLASKTKKQLSATRSFYVSMLLPGEETRFFDLKPDEDLTIGRSHECGIVISSNSVSRKHARIAMIGFMGWVANLQNVHFPGMLAPAEGISFESLEAVDGASGVECSEVCGCPCGVCLGADVGGACQNGMVLAAV